jgi:hypothetical protein
MAKRRGPDQKDLVRWYMDETGKTEVDMHQVARWLILKGYKMKEPPTQVELLAKQLSKQAREETRTDIATGRPYRAYHAFTQRQGEGQLTFWVDIDKAPRKPMVLSFKQRKEQMIGDGLQLSFDIEHWNGAHTGEDPIKEDFDLNDEIEWRRNAPRDDEKAS